MSNHSNPVDNGIVDLSLARRRITRIFLRDGQLDAEERAALDLHDASTTTISDYRFREKAGEHYARSGQVTEYTRRLFRDANLEVTPLPTGNIVPFPSRDEQGAG
jgi:hypothetical protein